MYATGDAPVDSSPRPSSLVIETTISALDHTIERAHETRTHALSSGDTQRLKSAASTEDQAQRLRQYVSNLATGTRDDSNH